MTVTRDRVSAATVWCLWASMLAAGLGFVATFGSNVPSWDDWDMVPTLTGRQPVTVDWLWSQHNEHRVPLPRLLFLALNRLTVIDFRVTMYFDVLAMAGLGAAMLVVVRRIRGRTTLADAFFPLLLLNWGQAANLLWGWQLQFYLSVIIACIALLALVRGAAAGEPGAPVRRTGIVVGICALLLPLCGANGLGMVPALALWPAALALLPERWTGAPGLRGDRLLLTLAAGALVLTGLYFVGWSPVPYHPKSHSVHQTLETALQVVTIGLGPAVRGVWPLSGLAVIALFGGTAAILAWTWRAGAELRAGAGGLLLFLGALGSLALGLGLGRNGFETRYITLAVPAWCAVYLAWTLCGPPSWRPPLQGLLALASLVALWPNSRFGLHYARELRGQLGGFERDLASGVPLHELVHRYGPWLHPHQDTPLQYLPMLRDAGVGHYVALKDDPPFQVVPLDLRPARTEQLSWSDSMAHVVGPKPSIVFTLPTDRVVSGLRLRYRYRSKDGTLPYIALHWKTTAQPEFPEARFYKFSPTGDRANWERGTWDRIGDPETTLTVWICDTVGQLEITPDFRPAVFRIAELSLLVPKE